MANLYIAIPAPAGNGPGDPVDMTTMGALKTITVVGNASRFEPFVTIEISNQETPTKWAPLATFPQPDLMNLTAACRWMRANVSNYKGGGAPTVRVGGGNQGCQFVELVALPGAGIGNEVDVSALGMAKTITVGGPFRGVVNVEVSEDGLTFQTIKSFSSPGFAALIVTAKDMRVSRIGVPVIDPGLPLVNVGAQSQIAVPLFPVSTIQTSDFTAMTGIIYQTNTSGGDVNVQMPPAANRNGQWVGFRIDSVDNFTNAVPAGADTINGGGVFPMSGSFTLLLISDGISNWIPGV